VHWFASPGRYHCAAKGKQILKETGQFSREAPSDLTEMQRRQTKIAASVFEAFIR
jgi:hypothetical protein